MLRQFTRACLAAAALFACLIAPLGAADPAVIRIGVLQYGTVSWELEVMKRMGFAEREGVRIEVVPLAQKDAANVALQGGAVDLIVNDWIWVARQRAEGRDFAFVPYSRAVGGIMVRPDANVHSLADLRGKRLGVAGGALDKSWLLLRAWSRKSVGEDAATFVKPDFGAPPLRHLLHALVYLIADGADLNHGAVGLGHPIADLDVPTHDLAFDDTFTDVRKNELKSHVLILRNARSCRPPRGCASVMGDNRVRANREKAYRSQ